MSIFINLVLKMWICIIQWYTIVSYGIYYTHDMKLFKTGCI